MTFGSLFAGIGGIDLGFERAGMQCAWQVEIDERCSKVLGRHWPNTERWSDIRTCQPRAVADEMAEELFAFIRAAEPTGGPLFEGKLLENGEEQ